MAVVALRIDGEAQHAVWSLFQVQLATAPFPDKLAGLQRGGGGLGMASQGPANQCYGCECVACKEGFHGGGIVDGRLQSVNAVCAANQLLTQPGTADAGMGRAMP